MKVNIQNGIDSNNAVEFNTAIMLVFLASAVILSEQVLLRCGWEEHLSKYMEGMRRFH